MPGPTLLFIGPFDQLPRKAAAEGGGEGGSQKVGCGSSGGQKSKTQDRETSESSSDFKIDVLTFRPRASIFVQTVVVGGNPSDQLCLAS